jgi:hypothetical protein
MGYFSQSIIKRLNGQKEQQFIVTPAECRSGWNPYKNEKNSVLYGPEFKQWNDELNEPSIHWAILRKISFLQVHQILWGKTWGLVEEDWRQYEFRLGEYSPSWGIFHLYIKDKKGFFNPQNEFSYKYNEGLLDRAAGEWQIIPITYTTLSRMTDEELMTIYTDLD